MNFILAVFYILCVSNVASLNGFYFKKICRNMHLPFIPCVQGVSIVKPVVYGNIARYFGKKREEDGHTHEWTVYLKPYHNEDMSTYVKKVFFNKL